MSDQRNKRQKVFDHLEALQQLLDSKATSEMDRYDLEHLAGRLISMRQGVWLDIIERQRGYTNIGEG